MIDINRCPECGSENVSTFPNPHDLAYYGHYRYHCRECKRSWQAPPQEQKPPMTTADELAVIRRRYPVGEWFNFTDSDAPAKLSQALTDIHSLQGALDAMTAERDAALARVRELEDGIRRLLEAKSF